jgi:carboxymethylenebutenolidase
VNHFQRYLIEEFGEDYTEGRISRRQALKLIASVTGSLVVATTFLAGCAPPAEETTTAVPNTPAAENTEGSAATATTAPAEPTEPPVTTDTAEPAAEASATGDGPASTPPPAGTVTADDPAIQAGPVEFPGEDDENIMGYGAWPFGDGPFPLVLVCHENRGLTDHIRDVTRRVAKAGYVGLAVDLLSRQGGTDAVGSDNVPGALGQTSPEQFVADFRSGWQYMGEQPFTDPARLGMMGFCFGGGVTWQVATQVPELKAAVPFYGPHPDVAAVPNIQAAVLAIYGGLDSRINGGIPAIEAAMQANNKIYEPVIYEGADHAFHNDTSGRYNAEAATDAWGRAMAWFGEYL